MSYRLLYLLLAAGFIAFLIYTPDSGYDKYYLVTWMQHTMTHGIGRLYEHPEANYPPLIPLLMHGFTWFFDGPADITYTSVSQFKKVVMAFDIATLCVAASLLAPIRRNAAWILLLLLNPAFWYNTVVWGQFDSVHTFFILCMICALSGQRPVAATLFFTLAINTKLQSLIFLPFLVLVLLPVLLQYPKRILPAAATAIGLQALLLAPFIIGGDAAVSLKGMWGRSVDFYPMASMHAWNAWYLVLGTDPYSTPDSMAAAGLTLKQWGLLAFFMVSSLILIPLAARTAHRIRTAEDGEAGGDLRRDLEKWLPAAGLVSVAFFFFNTQMHERYVHPALLFTGLYAVLAGRYLPYLLVSVAYLANMEYYMDMARYIQPLLPAFLQDYREWMLFDARAVAVLFLAALLSGLMAPEFRRHLRDAWLQAKRAYF